MYKKYGIIFMTINCLFFVIYAAISVFPDARTKVQTAFGTNYTEILGEETINEVGTSYINLLSEKESGQRIIQYEVLKKTSRIDLSEEDYEVLLRIVQAEAGGEDEFGKILVADVIINRVISEDFPNSVKEVVFQNKDGNYQFSPVKSKRYYEVTVSDETIDAVNKALTMEDVSGGALYFVARKYTSEKKMEWFDTKLVSILVYGGHEFYM